MSRAAVWRLGGRAPGVGSGAAPGVPVAEVEAFGPGLPDKQMKQFKAGHERADFCAKNDFPALKSESKGTIEMYLKCSSRLRICHGECIILVHSPSCTAPWGL